MNSKGILRSIGKVFYSRDFIVKGSYAGYEINVQHKVLGINLAPQIKYYRHTEMHAIDYVGRQAINANCQRRLIFDTAKEAETAQTLLQQGKEIISFDGQACSICRHNSLLKGATTSTAIAQPIIAIIDVH